MLVAAEALIRETGSVSFSVGELARRSNSSVASLYNMIGTKSTIIYALLNEVMDGIIFKSGNSRKLKDPISAALDASEMAANFFTSDPDFLRPLYGYLLGVADETHRPAFMARSLAFWLTRLEPISAAGLLPPQIPLEAFAQDHMLFFAGALDQWVQGELDNSQFEQQVRTAAIMRLLIIDDQSIRERLLRDM
ncbi:TetR/AcrR family transcriptional regulator [Novosphingobium colocasiae]|uniref:TetR/AcrR family transcriptional regulator n=1 Tax=Novosphingobium colocasiae TaxID=1256513 RepID=UPI001E4B58F2|nr:TetR/AcrR family transcriptional regulator [Novosphingobium colocasiae]